MLQNQLIFRNLRISAYSIRRVNHVSSDTAPHERVPCLKSYSMAECAEFAAAAHKMAMIASSEYGRFMGEL
jgi:hypothetical protein